MVNLIRPSSLSRTLALVPPVVALVAQHASGSIFLKVESSNGMINGESTDTKHAGWIDVSSMQFGVTNPVTLSNGQINPGKSVSAALTITKALDWSSPQLFLGCAMGIHYPTVTLELTSFNGTANITYYRITLSNVVVSSLSTASNADRPSESVSMSYEKITTDYYMMDPKGGLPMTPTSTATWNFATSSPK